MELNTIQCIDALSFLKALPASSVDMIFTDPPYGHNNNNNGDLIHRWEVALGKQKVMEAPRAIANDGVEANDLLRSVLPEIKRVMKPGAVLCCCCGGGGPDPQFARWSLWIDEVLEFKQMIVWDKGSMGMGWHYRRSYETVLVAMKPGAACKWYDETNKVENIIRPGDYGIRKIIPQNTDHPTPKPIQLAQHFIGLHTGVGELVVDPFAGGGSTLLAATKMGRFYMGCDLSPEYVALATKRLSDTDPFQSTEIKPGLVQPSLFEGL